MFFIPIIGIPLGLCILVASMGLIAAGMTAPGVALLFAAIL